MDVLKAIETRHSYRGPYRDSPVPRKDLETILDAGIRAPSGYNEQTTCFIAVDDASAISQISKILGNQSIAGAKALVVVCMDLSAKERRSLYFGVEDYAAACENILLAATALGYAGVWIDGALRRDDRAAQVAALLGVPSSFEVRVVIPLGVPAEAHTQKEKKPFGERAFFNRFGAA
jgi:nitroreductase